MAGLARNPMDRTYHVMSSNCVVPMQLADMLGCKLSEKQLELCVRLIESGRVDAAALALLVAELQRSNQTKSRSL